MTVAPRYSPTELAATLGLHPPTDEQADVIAAPPGPLVVIAGAGAGKTPVSKDDAQRHAQLALYQLAIAQGLAQADGAPGGGRLVYLGKAAAGGATERSQDALTPDAAEQWRKQVGQAAAATAGPQFVGRVNAGCAHCPVRPSCPAHHPRQEPS